MLLNHIAAKFGDAAAHAMRYIKLVCFSSFSTDMTNGIKKLKRHALSIQN